MENIRIKPRDLLDDIQLSEIRKKDDFRKQTNSVRTMLYEYHLEKRKGTSLRI